MSQLTVSVSPHIRSNRTTQKVMLDVLIALAPAVIASVVLFGWRSLLVIAVSTLTCVVSEYLFNRICRRTQTVQDLSAAVTGVILALNVPVTLPLWQMVIGAAIAIVVVKCLFGGLGQNFANPAMTARVVMLLSFSSTMAAVCPPIAQVSGDVMVSAATPLGVLKGLEGTLPSHLDLLLGIRSGALGETCALALLVGGVYLLVRKVITWHIPSAYIGTVFLFTLALGGFDYALAHTLSGGLMIGAIFMATDYTTSPNTPLGKLIFGIGCGLITVLIRVWGSYPEGVSYAILLMNILTPFIRKATRRKPLGGAKA